MPRAPFRLGLHRPLAAAGLGLLLAVPLTADDTLIRRSGERVSGRLAACVGEVCQWEGGSVRRAEIAWIGLGESGAPPAPADPARDEVWTRDGRSLAGPIVGVSLGVVAIEGESIDRPDVAWLYFGSASGSPSVAPAPSPAPPRGPPPGSPPPPPSAPPHTPAPLTPSSSPSAAPSPATPARLLLNEVAALGDAPFVELRNPSRERIALDGVALRSGGGAACSLPAAVTLDPDEIYLVRLGEVAAGEARCPADLLAAGAAVDLISKGETWDRLEWGNSPAGLALRTRGGRVSEPRPGASFGRPPGGQGDAVWVSYSPAQVTPGAANPVPAVDSFAALPGALFERAEVPLTWYTVGGASRYRVQVASSPDFGSPALDRIVETGGTGANAVAQLVTDPLADGTWYWRVKALGDGGEAPASEPQSFAVETAGKEGATAAGGGAAGESPNSEDAAVVLGVPWIEQAKDTRLLALEALEESGPDPWDAPWQKQPPYCARASIAMVNRFYGGRASQDRINYSVFHDRHQETGPEIDLWILTGLDTPMMKKALRYALGAPASARWLVPAQKWEEEYSTSAFSTEMFIWQHVVDEIDAGRAVVGTSECHAWVYGGYRRRNGELQLLVLDPAMGPYYFRPGVFRELTGGEGQPAGEGLAEAFFLPPRDAARPASDEASIGTDQDADGVMDFDEEVRFGTEAAGDDSDDDGVPDKAEIRASVFEPPDGWSLRTRALGEGQRFPLRRDTFRDLDGDGKAMELDPDSDGGGCEDGEEDLDLDGRRDPGEPSNFDPADDPVNDEGACDFWTGTSTSRFTIPGPDGWTEITIEATYRVRAARTAIHRDPGPALGGRRAGDPIARITNLSCEGTTLHSTWRQRFGSSGSTCECTGDAALTVAAEPRILDGFVDAKLVDWDLTPLFGFDIPREGGLYSVACGSRGERGFPVTCTCSDGSTRTDDVTFPYPAGAGLGNPGTEPRCNHDPELRSLAGGGNQMVGSYSHDVPGCGKVDMTWSLCKAGTPCATLPPLPGSSAAEPEAGAATPP